MGKEVFHPCTKEAIYTIIFLFGFSQSLTPNIKYNDVDMTFICTIMSIYVIFKEAPMLSSRTTLIPNQNIRTRSRQEITVRWLYIPGRVGALMTLCRPPSTTLYRNPCSLW